MSITWSIKEVNTVDESNYTDVVKLIRWKAEIKDGNLSEQRHGSVSMQLDESKDFVPFEQLTEDDYLQWIFDSAMSKDDVESDLQEALERLKTFTDD